MSHNLGTIETILLAELRVGLPPLFYTRLLDITDDWAFVLKLHSFFEGTLTKLLQEKLALRRSHEIMTPRDTFVSRVHLAERLDLIEPDYRAFLLSLNRLRNDITHNIRFIDFDLRQYVDSLSDSDFRRTAYALCAGFKNTPMDDIVAKRIDEDLKRNQRISEETFDPAIREVVAGFLPASNPRPEIKRRRVIRTVREYFWQLSPKTSLWNAGVSTLDLLSLHFHFEELPTGGFRSEPDLDAKIQDLLLDPAVLKYKRRVEGL